MKNLERLKEIYLLSFTDDTKEDADFLFENVFSHAVSLTKEKDGQTASMLYLMECTVNTKDKALPFYYLYAACTHPKYRGRGLMGALLEDAKKFAEENKKEGIILKPAKPSLFDFYKKYGFDPFFKVYTALLGAEDLKKYTKCNKYELSLEQWHGLRFSVLKNISDCFLTFPKDVFCAAANGCRVATDAKGSYVVYEVREDLLLCKECIVGELGAEGVLAIARTLAEELNVKRAELRFPPCTKLSNTGLGKTSFFSVTSNQGLTAHNPYHGFAFD